MVRHHPQIQGKLAPLGGVGSSGSSENLFGIVTRCLNSLAYRRCDRDKHPGRSGGDTLKANDGENTKTTTGGFDPDGPNLDYVDGGDGCDTCYVDPGHTYVNCQVLYIQQPVSSTTASHHGGGFDQDSEGNQGGRRHP